MLSLNDLHNDNFAVNLIKHFSDCNFANYEQSRSLFVLHQNIRSLRKNFDLLVSNLSVLSRLPDFIFVSETWIFDNEKNDFSIPGYDFFHVSNESYSAGGVGVFAKSNLLCRAISYSMESADVIKVSCNLGSEVFNFFCFYKLHSHTSANFLNEFDRLLSKNHSSNLLLLGDFNFDLLLDCENTDAYSALLAKYGLHSFLNEPTRPSSGACLDHINGKFSIQHDIYDCFNIDLSITDHCLTGIMFNCPDKNPINSNPIARNQIKIDYEKLKNFLRFESWENVYSLNDVSLAYSHFLNTLKRCVSLSECTIRPKTNMI